ncbi:MULTISPECIES: FTR1 family protein [unclassified Actinomyces]|uniref:FTR1 family iron permease n=1 Tax=unclassified Actinomyces TaxID=2609248 RepID=UPI0024B4AF12|nr:MULTISPECIES: FTR1 family protein [unclassified Actinomyces]MCL3776699.1 FTR1 family iron permease [Actinomyces sp. AC-20-1]MCL3790622.1 FTR1 family iron permease [Actinomyces sp. 187325]MCL3792937.1 FTR1 family iron permease [Actinomyces sp. 186855]MCL3795350.1 FTR1 family iron permease [Actinomyces sp. 217892]
MPSQTQALAGPRSCTPSGRVGRAAVVALAVLVLLLGALSPLGPRPTSAAAEADTDFDTWTQVAERVSDELGTALEEYAAADHPGAAAAVLKAQSSGYVASNMRNVVTDTLGADVSQSHTEAFTSLASTARTAGNEEALSTGVTDLVASLTEAATALDATEGLPGPRDHAQALATRIAEERAAIDARSTADKSGRGDRTWVEVATEMNELIDQGLAQTLAGDGSAGAELVNEAYYGYYEKLGFEKKVMTVSGDRVSLVESTFKNTRKAMIAGDTEAATEHAQTLKTYLLEDAQMLDGGAAEDISPLKAFFTGSFGQAFLILIREGLEAILVVAAVIAYLVQAGMRDRVKHVYAGVVLALLASGVVAALFSALFNSASAYQEALEGAVALIAMLMLLFTSNWMLSKSSVSSWNRYIKDRTEASVSEGGFWGLVSLSFLAVFREGAETVLFYQALFAMDPTGSASIWQGFAAAAAVLLVIFLLIRYTSVRIPLRPFFAVTSFLMAVLVVIFAGGGAHSLLEGDIIPATYLEGVPTYDVLGFYPYVETIGFQAVMVVVVLVLSIVSVMRHRRAAQDS